MNRKAVEAAKIVGLCVFASVVYGIIHDQITARVYLPYFTVYHPHIIDSQDPTVMALLWGVIATWWAGLIVSIPLVFTATLGEMPLIPFGRVVKAVGLLLLGMGVCAALVGLISYYAGVFVPFWVHPSEFGGVEGARRFSAVLATHQTSYGVGFAGGLGLAIWADVTRRKLRGMGF